MVVFYTCNGAVIGYDIYSQGQGIYYFEVRFIMRKSKYIYLVFGLIVALLFSIAVKSQNNMVFDKKAHLSLDTVHKDLLVGNGKMWIIDSIVGSEANSVVIVDNNDKIPVKALKGKSVKKEISLAKGSVQFVASEYFIKRKQHPLLENDQ